MTRLVEQVVDRLRADARIDASSLALRVDALARFRRAAEPYLPPDWLQPARAVAVRAGQRLALSRAHTLVAIAGGTGGGKSSLFNALAGGELSPVGVRRPTTGAAYACVWGPATEAAPMLDWLRVPPDHRFTRERAPGADPAAAKDDLRGLVLLDLPDFDSVEGEHAVEVERLLALVDLVVWVVDPQKYADRVLHERYLRRFRRHRDVTMLALNQADLLGDADVVRLLADLRDLLAADGLPDVPVLATSAVIGPDGVTELRAALERTVTARRAALQRLAADVDEAVAGLADLVGPAPSEITVDRVPELVNGLAEAAGVAAVTRAVGASYRRRARAALTWPPLRWLPHRRVEPPEPGAPGAVERAAASLAVRAVADRASAGLPPPWPDAVAEASRSHLDALPDAVTSAVATAAASGDPPAPGWWRLLRAAQWLAAGLCLGGLGWLVVGWLLQVLAVPVSHPRVGPASAPALLLVGGLVAGAGLVALVRPLVRWAARRAQGRVAGRLRSALAEVGDAQVVAPVREVLGAYAEARAALHAASPR